MFRFRIIHNLKSALWLLLFAFIPLALITLVWANNTGLPDSWRYAIEKEISKNGFHVKLDSLTYVPLRGFVAKDVRIYAEDGRIHELARLEEIGLTLDYSSLASGQPRLRKIQLRNANISLPVDPENPAGQSLSFSKVNGTIFMPNETLLEFRDTKANVGGIDITLNARLFGKRQEKQNSPEEYKNESRRRELIANIITELENWNFDSQYPPQLKIDVEGDLTDPKSINAKFLIDAPSIERRQYRLENLKAQGTLSGHLLTISSISANDQRGNISGSIDYQLLSRDGNFDMETSIDIPRLLKSWLQTSLNLDLLTGGSQKFIFAGDFNLTDLQKPVVNLTGHAHFDSIMLRGVSFSSFDSWFSYQNGSLFLKNMKLTRPDGTASGKLLREGDVVRIQIESTLPAAIYKPFFIGQPLELILNDFKAKKDATCNLSIEGSFNLKDRFAWSYTGKGSLTNTSYRDVPLKATNCSFVVNHHELDFYDGSTTFDYSNKKNYNGPSSGTAKFARIRYDNDTKTIAVENVSGDFFAAPMTRMFAPKIADDLEQYRFHTPPSLSGSGIIDVTPKGRTDLTVNFKTDDKATYKFLGENLILSQPKATVRVTGSQVYVSKLSANTLSGDIAAEFTHHNSNGLSGEITWSKLSLPEISTLYDFNLEGGGQLTGRLEFSIKGSDIKSMNGSGLIALENGELFSVPIFGPLSTVAGAVVNDKRFGSERAEDAFCNFKIKNGVLSTRDFQTSTTSVKFTGDGSIDLSEQNIDFTIRLNARGLLGLITLPFKPFYGLFQFRGTGPLKKPTWENVHFTSPPPEQDEILLKDPPKAEIIPE